MQSSKPTVIYLDSSDYSTLTRPHLEPSQSQELAALRALKKRKDVMFGKRPGNSPSELQH
ncbi:hypothetical protein [uncultured Pseudomonas sp.]|uniref:hypothetical protein n=1 Tax=uncultured Pseudomonas sp. TaxID=114707 RepID=UPI0025DFD395|nr:hypothetical protein [uncultured Pseudomonas sp.]